jgi:RNA polymerase sigma factor (TIGR02999 family)
MSEVSRILVALDAGDARDAGRLLPLVYDELRHLAAARLGREKPGQTLTATALVHEAYLKLVGPDPSKPWNGRGHFFAAAAEAMRRILVDHARRKQAVANGGGLDREVLDPQDLPFTVERDPSEVLGIEEVLNQLAEKSPRKAELVKLRYFLDCTVPEAADILGISATTAEADWTYAKAWLRRRLGDRGGKNGI